MNNVDITKVCLLSVPLENSCKNTLYFSDKDSQYDYFISRKVYECTDFTYQRKNKTMRIPKHIDFLEGHVNYVMYQNPRYSDKWFYAYITEFTYISDGVTEISIETDVIQTWLFDYKVNRSFIEREHVASDEIGEHTVPENLETGEYICNEHTIDPRYDDLMSDVTYVLATTLDITNLTTTSDGTIIYESGDGDTYNGIYSGCTYYKFDSKLSLNNILKSIANHGQVEGIVGIFMCPKWLCEAREDVTEGATCYPIKSSDVAESYNITIRKKYGFEDYGVRNQKLKTYPFCYLIASNNQGSASIYQYEKFSNAGCEFVVNGAITPGCSIRMTPKNYKGCEENDDESINLGKYPICSYNVDMYTNWLTQNSINVLGGSYSSDDLNIMSSALSGTMQTLGGLGMLLTPETSLSGATNVFNGITSGVMGVTNALMSKKQHQMIPNQIQGNVNSGDVITGSQKNAFHFYNMSISKEYAKIIDDYFDMYGYACNRVKEPNTNHRESWWYTKTIGANISGSIPNNDLNKIRQIYDNGITFWREATKIGRYSGTNYPNGTEELE